MVWFAFVSSHQHGVKEVLGLSGECPCNVLIGLEVRHLPERERCSRPFPSRCCCFVSLLLDDALKTIKAALLVGAVVLCLWHCGHFPPAAGFYVTIDGEDEVHDRQLSPHEALHGFVVVDLLGDDILRQRLPVPDQATTAVIENDVHARLAAACEAKR